MRAALLAGHAATSLALLRAAPPDDALRLMGMGQQEGVKADDADDADAWQVGRTQ